MEPFAYPKARKPGTRKLILLALAGVSFSIWYFDLFPEIGQVPTGEISQKENPENLNEDDFIRMLNSAPEADPAGAAGTTEAEDNDLHLPSLSEDPLVAALAKQSDRIESEFPEFADVPDSQPPAPPTTGIQQASYESPIPASTAKPEPPAVLSAETAAQLRQAELWIQQDRILDAHEALSRLYWKEPEIRPQIQQQIEETAALIYASRDRHFAEPYMVQYGDTLESIAAEFKVPYQYLALLNRTRPEDLQAGQKLKVLTGPFGAVVDLDSFEMTVHAHVWFVRRYQIGIGADGATPIGEFTVQNKQANPTWYNPDGGVIDADDPSNPLGEYWLGLGDHIGIHGTIDPGSIGKAVSRGCIHLADDDIAEVFHLLSTGSPVVIRK